jgi:hypothetical protein
VTTDTPAVEDVAAAVYVIPTDAPEGDGTLAWNSTTLVLVTASAGGEQGIGWTYAAAAAGGVVADVLAGSVVGRSAFDIPGAAEAMARAVRNIGRGGIAATAISAVDIALWDLKARLLGVPVTGLLGRAREHVPGYGSGGFTTYDEQQTRDQLSGWVDKERIPRVKIKIAESWGSDERRDLARVALAREVIGPDTELYVDARRTACRCPGTVPLTCTRTPQPRSRTCGTSSSSMTISGSSSCSSTGPSIRPAACSPPIPAGPGSACSYGAPTPSTTGRPDRCRPQPARPDSDS